MISEAVLGDRYRFGFNGAEKIDEIKGFGNTPDLGDRYHDPRLGRMNWKTDRREAEYPGQSPYAYYANSPVWKLDYNGEGGKEYEQNNRSGYDRNKPTVMPKDNTAHTQNYRANVNFSTATTPPPAAKPTFLNMPDPYRTQLDAQIGTNPVLKAVSGGVVLGLGTSASVAVAKPLVSYLFKKNPSVGAGLADATSQLLMKKGEDFNVSSTLATSFTRFPITAILLSNAFEIKIKNFSLINFNEDFSLGLGGKSVTQFSAETIFSIGGEKFGGSLGRHSSNVFGNQGIGGFTGGVLGGSGTELLNKYYKGFTGGYNEDAD